VETLDERVNDLVKARLLTRSREGHHLTSQKAVALRMSSGDGTPPDGFWACMMSRASLSYETFGRRLRAPFSSGLPGRLHGRLTRPWGRLRQSLSNQCSDASRATPRGMQRLIRAPKSPQGGPTGARHPHMAPPAKRPERRPAQSNGTIATYSVADLEPLGAYVTPETWVIVRPLTS